MHQTGEVGIKKGKMKGRRDYRKKKKDYRKKKVKEKVRLCQTERKEKKYAHISQLIQMCLAGSKQSIIIASTW